MENLRFLIYKDGGRDYRFRLVSSHSTIILFSSPFRSKAGVLRSIANLLHHLRFHGNFSRRLSPEFQYYFIVRSREGHILATSRFYEQRDAREADMDRLKFGWSTGQVDDLTLHSRAS